MGSYYCWNPWNKNEAYETLLEELEESIIIWQKKVKQNGTDKRFNARAYLAEKMGYKDPKLIYRFLDVNDISRAKLGVKDVQIIADVTGDYTPFENFIKSGG